MIRALLGTLLLVPSIVRAAPIVELHYVMGTYLRITAPAAARPAMRQCFREARRLEEVFSRFDPTSELTRVNAAAGPTRVTPDFALLLARSQRLAAATDGAFDVTVGAVTALWRREAPPSDEELALARGGVGSVHATLDGATLVRAPSTRLDFDGIAKGWAVDACTRLLRAAGVRSALVSFGESSIAALGHPSGAPDWTLGVRGAEPDDRVGRLHLRDLAVSVSATYGATGRQPGRVAHIVDPHTGRPLVDEAVGLVVARSATDAEAWSKALLVWGAGGVARIEALGAAGAVYVGPAGIRRGAAAGAARLFEARDDGARLAAARDPS